MREFKLEPPYVCKVPKPSNGKNPIEPKSEKFVTKTYMFDVTECDEILDLLVFDGQIVIPKGLKTPPLEQRKKKRFSKCHNFLGDKTSQCVLFKDLVKFAYKKKASSEGRG